MTPQPNDPPPALPAPSPARPARTPSDTLARGGLALALVVAAVAAFLAWDARQDARRGTFAHRHAVLAEARPEGAGLVGQGAPTSPAAWWPAPRW